MSSAKNIPLLPNHVTPAEFAEIKGVTPKTVRNNLGSGNITADLIGRTKKITMIDLEKYMDYKFPTHPNRKPGKNVRLKK